MYERIWAKGEQSIGLLVRYHSRTSGSKKSNGHRGNLKRSPQVIEAGYGSPAFQATVCVGDEGIELTRVRTDYLVVA